MPGGAPIVSLRKRESSTTPVELVVEEDDENPETDSLVLVDEFDNPDGVDLFGLEDTSTIHGDYLGIEEGTVIYENYLPTTKNEE